MKSQRLLVLIAFGLPVIFILAIILMIYIPPLFVSTDYDFVYAICEGSRDLCGEALRSYEVLNGKLVGDIDKIIEKITEKQQPSKHIPLIFPRIRFFLYQTKAEPNANRELTLAEVQSLNLSDRLVSPDGARVELLREYGSGDFFFFPFGFASKKYAGYYLIKNGGKRKLDLIIRKSDYYYGDSDYFRFIGWVLP